jgi:N-methylhydantoinase A
LREAESRSKLPDTAGRTFRFQSMDEKNPSTASDTVVAGIDVGGTFTDLILVDGRDGTVHIAKTPTTADNQAHGVIAALDAAEFPVERIDLIVHGTTTTTNAVLERRLARTGMITTRGFRDVIELGRRTRPQPYGMTGVFVPIIPRDLRLEVTERVEASGKVREPLNEDEVRGAAQRLVALGCESLVIHFLHSYANPAHERRAAEVSAEIWPNGYITMGHALLSEAREFERGVTAAVNASVQPILERYVERLRQELASRGYVRDFLVMNGNGGMISARHVTREAAKTVMSGPASGVIAAAETGRRAGYLNLVTYDMGGTSTDVALIRNAEPAVSNETEIEYAMPIHVPMVDVHTVGAGGGSIARVDASGLIQVGPESAGARPGPICYGRGGTDPTITDANLVLGRLAPKKLLSVDRPVSRADVEDVFARRIGRAAGFDGVSAAAAVLRLANMKMAGAIRMVSVARGHDPRDFALFAFGGAGPLHASALARELGLPKVLVPARPGITNALGCVLADLRHDFVNTINQPVASLDEARATAVLEKHRAEGQALIAKEAVQPREIRFLHSADMQFVGQTHILNVKLPSATVSRAEVQRLFEEAYFARFKVSLPEIRANLVNLNSSVIGVTEPLDLSKLIDPKGRAEKLEDALNEMRPVWFEGAFRDTPVYSREKLPLDAVVEGPAILEQLDATTVIEPGDRVSSDGDGNLIVDIGQR